ncbi:MAG: hypothetical protein LBE12_20595 [Planctomycetaceae bacterium]|jgi:hypothetical protein|nr:hypothetical protein [Planctomycetaceae bacterium]
MGLRQDFESALQSLKLELISDINRTNVLKKDNMRALATEYNQKIVKLQTDFLAMVASSNLRTKVEFKEPNPKELSDFGTITLTGLATGGTVYAGLTFITWGVVQTSPWFLFWTTTTTSTVSLAAWLATILGISSTLATGILTGGVGFIAMAAMYFTFYPVWRERIRENLLKSFDEEILPKLRDWADDVINKVNNS